MKNKGIPITIGLICMILGLMLAVQFKSVKTMNSKGIDKMRAEELQFALNAEKEKLDNTLRDLTEKEKKIEEYQTAAAKDGKLANVLKKDIEHAKMLAGLTTVQGQGIVVTLNDSKSEGQGEQIDENYFVIHDQDILSVINELRASGAEAISLNDQRIVSTSEIRCAGPAVSINNTRTFAPFVIRAIGNPDDMESALRMRNGVVDVLQQWGIEVNISKEVNLLIPKFNGVFTFDHAYPVKGEGGKQ